LPRGVSWDANWAIDVRNRVVALSGGDLVNDEVCVQIVNAATSAVLGSHAGSRCSTVTAPSTPSSATSGCVVKVWARTTERLETIFFSRPLTLDANAVGRYERSTECP